MSNKELLNVDLCNIIEHIIKIPFIFKTEQKYSIYELFKKSEYYKYYSYITENEIKKYLLQNKYLINYWSNYSEDKRVDKGYYLTLREKNYEVGYFDSTNKKNCFIDSIYTLSEEIDACAKFIKLELEEIKKIYNF